MRLNLRTAASTAAMLLLGLASASADPVRITSGSFAYPALPLDIAVDLSGDGFTFTGRALRMGMGFDPYQGCLVPACLPGSTLSLHTFGTEQNYAFVTVTYQGRTFTNFSGIDARSSVVTDWRGSLPIPSNFAGGVLTAPFSFSGVFLLTDEPSGFFQRGELVGSGTATVTLGPYGSPLHPDAFATTAVRFDFADAGPTPEPMSVVLVGTGLCGIVAARWRRARRA